MNFNIAMNSNSKSNNYQVKGNDAQLHTKPGSNNRVDNKQEEEQKQQENVNISNFMKLAAHPGVCLLTISLKIGSIVAFILLDLFIDSEALAYLVVILLGAADFWITKNISGRLLVGLRWWNEVKSDGKEVWIFESKHESKNYIKYLKIF